MAVIQWNQIKPDFSSSNRSMQNAMSGLSNAGTVFDKLRQSILDEEQRALDNAYKQQTFDENVRQFEARLAADEAKALADREHDIRLEDIRSKNEMIRINQQHKNDLALQQAKWEYDEKDKKAKAALHSEMGVLAQSLIAQGVPLRDVDKAVQQAFYQRSGGRFSFDPSLAYSGDIRDSLAIVNSPEVRANEYFNNTVEGSKRMGDTVGSEALRNPNSEYHNRELTDFIGRLRTDADNNTYIIDAGTGKSRNLTEAENTLLQQYRDSLQKEANTYSFLNTVNMTPEQAYSTFKQINDSSIGLAELRDSVAHMFGVDPNKVGSADITFDADVERNKQKLKDEAATQSEVEAENNLKPKAYETALEEFGKRTITKGSGNETSKINVSSEAQVIASNMSEVFKAAKVPVPQLKQFYNWLAATDQERVNSIINLSSFDTDAKNEALRVINTYRTGNGQSALTFDEVFKDSAEKTETTNNKPGSSGSSGSKTGISTVNPNQDIIDQLRKAREDNIFTANYDADPGNVYAYNPSNAEERKRLADKQEQLIQRLETSKAISIDTLDKESLVLLRQSIMKARIALVGRTRTEEQKAFEKRTSGMLDAIDKALKQPFVTGKLKTD